VTLREDPGEGHWYDNVLNNDQFREFLARVVTSASHAKPVSTAFTLTVAAPSEGGSLHGWKIESLVIPGRLARLHVSYTKNREVHVATWNVDTFSVDSHLFEFKSLIVDDSIMNVTRGSMGIIRFETNAGGRVWQVTSRKNSVQLSSRMQAILTTAGPIVLVVSEAAHMNEMSVALRISHDLDMYHKLDSEIVSSSEALQRLDTQKLGGGNIVVVGDTTSPFLRMLLKQPKTPFRLDGRKLVLDRRTIDGPELGIMFLHPHPTNPLGKVLCLLSTDEAGLERAARLFPIRTGIAVPDWIVLGKNADNAGAAGVIGAGVWGRNWSWNGPMSWLYGPPGGF